MALYRIQHILENNDTFHYTQTGFRRHLGTEDSLLMIYTNVLKTPSEVYLRILVAVAVKKAFDSGPHKSIIDSAVAHGVHRAPLNFINSFLEGVKSTVKVETRQVQKHLMGSESLKVQSFHLRCST